MGFFQNVFGCCVIVSLYVINSKRFEISLLHYFEQFIEKCSRYTVTKCVNRMLNSSKRIDAYMFLWWPPTEYQCVFTDVSSLMYAVDSFLLVIKLLLLLLLWVLFSTKPYSERCLPIMYWNFWNKLINLIQNTTIFMGEYAFENVLKSMAHSSRPQC